MILVYSAEAPEKFSRFYEKNINFTIREMRYAGWMAGYERDATGHHHDAGRRVHG
jgi:hypothetical protein